MTRRLSKPKGAAAVEFALVLPVLLLFLLGTIDWGYYFYTRQMIVAASHEGARIGSMGGLNDVQAKIQGESATLAMLARTTLQGVCTPTATVSTTSIRMDVRCQSGSLTGFLPGMIPQNPSATTEMRR